MTEQGVNEFEALRPKLFSVAYRMLGSATEAEDVVQDAWLRYATVDRDDVRSSEAFLTTIVTRLCLDRLKSARATREQYVGPWLPEPVLTDTRQEPEQSAALGESLTLAFLVLLETLSPEERAVFLLREVFEYPFADIAAIVGSTTDACRQQFHRAKARVAERRPRVERDPVSTRALVSRFVDAMRAGDADALTSLLAADVGFWGDGAGKVIAARRPILGREAVVHLLVGLVRSARAQGLARPGVEIVEVNHEAAVIFLIDGRIDSVYGCSVSDGQITGIRVVRNPDKLHYIARQLRPPVN